jgi:hypothetical protein
MWLIIKGDQYRANPPNFQYELGQSLATAFCRYTTPIVRRGTALWQRCEP